MKRFPIVKKRTLILEEENDNDKLSLAPPLLHRSSSPHLEFPSAPSPITSPLHSSSLSSSSIPISISSSSPELPFAEKYRPKSLDDILGNGEQIKKMKQWIEKLLLIKPETKKSNKIENIILISGSAGISKTTTAHNLLKHYGFKVLEFNASDIREKKYIDKHLQQISECANNIGNENVKNKAIIMDEVDGMSESMAKLILSLYRKQIPIICICNDSNDKQVEKIKKECKHIQFHKPTITELEKVFGKVLENEQCPLPTEDKIHLICQLAQGDFRRLMNLTQHYVNTLKTTPTNDDTTDLLKNFQMKLTEIDIKDALYGIQNAQGITKYKDFVRLLEVDKNMIPFHIYESTTAKNHREITKLLVDYDDIVGSCDLNNLYLALGTYEHTINTTNNSYNTNFPSIIAKMSVLKKSIHN